MTSSAAPGPRSAGRLPIEDAAHDMLELAHSMTLSLLATPIRAANSRMASAGKPAAQARDGGHARIVPAADMPLLDEGQQNALGGRVGDVSRANSTAGRDGTGRLSMNQSYRAGESRIPAAGECVTPSMRRTAVRIVVHRVDAPRLTGARMLGVHDSVHRTGRACSCSASHIDLARSTRAPLGNSPSASVRRGRGSPLSAFPPGAVPTGLGERAAVFADLAGREVVDVGLAGLISRRPLVQLLEVTGRVVECSPQSNPSQWMSSWMQSMYSCSSLVGFGVEAQVAPAAKVTGDAKVDADRLGVTDVQ